MAKNKTTETQESVSAYIESIADEKRRSDCLALTALLTNWTGQQPSMWGASIVGFGRYHYRYDSGHEGDAPLVGFSSRTTAITIYLATDFDHKEELLAQLGKYKTGKGCLYIKKLDDIDGNVLKELVVNSVEFLKLRYKPA